MVDIKIDIWDVIRSLVFHGGWNPQAYDVSFAPHCPLGPIALASCLQVDACAVNFVFQETSMGIHYNEEGGVDLLDYVVNKSALDVDSEVRALPCCAHSIHGTAGRALSLVVCTLCTGQWGVHSPLLCALYVQRSLFSVPYSVRRVMKCRSMRRRIAVPVAC